MKPIRVRFERDPALEEIEIVVRASAANADVSALMETLAAKNTAALTVVDDGGALTAIPVSRIVSVSVLGRQVHVVTEDGRYLSRQTLQSLESALDPKQFVRISRYEIINLMKERRYDFTLSGTLRLELVGGMETWASRRCIPLIRKRLTGKE